jgi:glycolate oxidase FAD binding subunit
MTTRTPHDDARDPRDAGEPGDLGDAAKALADAGVAVRRLDPASDTWAAGGGIEDAAGGRPRWAARPATVEQVAAVLKAASAHGLAVVPAGGGTRLHWGAPPERCDLMLDLGGLGQVLEHEAGDLVVRAQAGVTLRALNEKVAGGGQELVVEVPYEAATVGGALATGAAGPRRFRYGAARDLLIGVTVVLADGTIARSGGKVVKNVAGYDLGKLLTGSYGTLGVIAEATFRLHPLAADRRWVTCACPAEPSAAAGLTGVVAASTAEPSAVELDWATSAGPPALAVLVEGTAARPRADAVAELMRESGGEATVSGAPPAWWGRLPGDDTLLEARVPPGGLGAVLTEIGTDAPGGVRVRGSAASGALWVAPPPGLPAEGVARLVSRVRRAAEGVGGRLVVLTAPAEVTRLVDRWGQVGALGLMRRVKRQFDPGRVLSPGRFAGGI